MAIYLKKAQERPEQDLRAVSDLVREVLERVRLGGEAAVRYYSNKFDQWDPPSFRLSEAEVERAVRTLSSLEKEDIDFCQAQIRNFAEKQRLVGFEVETFRACTSGRRSYRWPPAVPISPAAAIRCWVGAHDRHHPQGGRGFPRGRLYPPVKGQGLWPATLYSMVAAGADEIYCMGGVHALAAHGLRHGRAGAGGHDRRRREHVRRGSEEAAVRHGGNRSPGRTDGNLGHCRTRRPTRPSSPWISWGRRSMTRTPASAWSPSPGSWPKRR